MATSLKVTTIEKHNQQDALEQTMRAIKAYAELRNVKRATSDKLTKARDVLYKAFEGKVFAGSDTVSALTELRRYKLVMPAKSIPVSDPIKLTPIPQPVQDNTQTNLSVEVVGPPYADQWVWGNQGQHQKDKTTGVANIAGLCGAGEAEGVSSQDDDHLEGAAGITALITADRPAFVNVNAQVLNRWAYGIQAHGGFSSASVRGGIDMAAFIDGHPIDGPRRMELFSDSVNDFNQVTHTGNGVEFVQVNFNIQPGQVVGVPFGAWLICDHSSGIGSAGAFGSVALQIASLTIVRHF